jgi:ribonucleoside-triphosphate reductase (thioredoxin)
VKSSDLISRSVDQIEVTKFELDTEFLSEFSDKEPPWGPLGAITYYRTYANTLPNGKLEKFYECAKRVVEGTFYLLKLHLLKTGQAWNREDWNDKAEKMYRSMFDFRFLPPGRGLWGMGTEALYVKGGGVLANCGFVSTKDIATDFSRPFLHSTDLSMLGAGMGVDSRGAETVLLRVPITTSTPFVVEDSREGWLEAYKRLLESFASNTTLPRIFDCSKLRPVGAKLKTFGGKSGGPAPLLWLLQEVITILLRNTDHKATIRTDLGGPVKQNYDIDEPHPTYLFITLNRIPNSDLGYSSLITANQIRDIFGCQGACVSAGGRRRSSYLQIGSPEDETFWNYKNTDDLKELLKESKKESCDPWELTQLQDKIDNHRQRKYLWASNNSNLVPKNADNSFYRRILENCLKGEDVGIFNLENCISYGRLEDGPDNKTDQDILGVNACGEMPQADDGLCFVVEVVLTNIDTLEEFLNAIDDAYLYAKVCTLAEIHLPRSDRVNKDTRRIGISLAGVMQIQQRISRNTLNKWLDIGYKYLRALDTEFSKKININTSVALTTIKPGGTIPKLPGATAGGHTPIAEYYIQNMRFANNSDLLPALRAANYKIEKAVNEQGTLVVSIPVKERDFSLARGDQSVRHQLDTVYYLQRYWADNSVSNTIEFEYKDIEEIIAIVQRDNFKSLAFFPRQPDLDNYPQLPIVKITEEEYLEYSRKLLPIDFDSAKHDTDEAGCEGLYCKLSSELSEFIE